MRSWSALFVLLVSEVVLVFSSSAQAELSIPPKLYECLDSGECRLQDPLAGQTGGRPQAICLMTCGKGMLWPYPTGAVSLSSEVNHFSTGLLKVTRAGAIDKSSALDSLFSEMIAVFLGEVAKIDEWSPSSSSSSSTPSRAASNGEVDVAVHIKDLDVLYPSPDNDESYSLVCTTSNHHSSVRIEAQTVFGARHALETLSQLIAWDEQVESLAIVAQTKIQDRPAFAHRGIMIDVSRNFIPMSKLRENLAAASYNKMNVLHLHLSDTASFPLSTPSQPNMTAFGAYDRRRVYSVADMTSFTEEARIRGVMLLPEIDAPAHMSAGWQWGAAAGLGELVLCTDPAGQHGSAWTTDALEPPSGQLNLVNPHALNILNDVYGDVLRTFHHPDYFHLGGDEVIVGSDDSWAACYNSTSLAAPLLEVLAERGLPRTSETFYALWLNFTQQAADLVRRQYSSASSAIGPRKQILWGGGGGGGGGASDGVLYNLLSLPDLPQQLSPQRFAFQVWDEVADSAAPRLLREGYEVILSHTDYVYLDCGNAGFVQAGGYWCQPYHEWFRLYDYLVDARKAWKLDAASLAGLRGAEALIWTEMVDEASVTAKLWPRAAALAEALWSDPQAGWYAASGRMLQWREKLQRRGVAAEALQPRWCVQREAGVCYLDGGVPQ